MGWRCLGLQSSSFVVVSVFWKRHSHVGHGVEVLWSTISWNYSAAYQSGLCFFCEMRNTSTMTAVPLTPTPRLQKWSPLCRKWSWLLGTLVQVLRYSVALLFQLFTCKNDVGAWPSKRFWISSQGCWRAWCFGPNLCRGFASLQIRCDTNSAVEAHSC